MATPINQVVLIAGATSMIGRACAHVLDDRGYSTILLGRNEEKLQVLSQSLKRKTEYYTVDFSSPESLQKTLDDVIHAHPNIYACIYNIGIYPWHCTENLPLEDWKSALDINLTAAFILTQAIIPLFKQHNKGRLIYMSSIAGETIGLPSMGAYAASKAGLNGLMRTVALELAPFQATANSISPGKVYDAATLTPEEIASKLKTIPLKRFVDPMDIAHMSHFLCSDKASMITGQNIVIDGGQTVT